MTRRAKSSRVTPDGRLLSTWASEDGITITPPSAADVKRGKPYHRIVYYDGAGTRRFASGGRTFQDALDALPFVRKRMEAQLSRDVDPAREVRLPVPTWRRGARTPARNIRSQTAVTESAHVTPPRAR
jgi:hypothetical protein